MTITTGVIQETSLYTQAMSLHTQATSLPTQGTPLQTQHITPCISLSSTTQHLLLSSTPTSRASAVGATHGPKAITLTRTTPHILTPVSVFMDTTTQSTPSSKTAEFSVVDTSILVGLVCVVVLNIGICATLSILLLKWRRSRGKRQNEKTSKRGSSLDVPNTTPSSSASDSTYGLIPIVTNRAYTGSREAVGSSTASDHMNLPSGFTSSSTGQYELRGPDSESYYDYPASYTGGGPFYDYPFQHVPTASR